MNDSRRDWRWRLREWFSFGCPPHRLGPMQDTPMGFGQKCEKCALWKWRDDDETANRLLREGFDRKLRARAGQGQVDAPPGPE